MSLSDGLFFFDGLAENHNIIKDIEYEVLTGLHAVGEQLLGKLFQYPLLDHTLEGAGTELGVIAFVGEPIHSVRGDGHRNTLLREGSFEAIQLKLDDTTDISP